MKEKNTSLEGKYCLFCSSGHEFEDINELSVIYSATSFNTHSEIFTFKGEPFSGSFLKEFVVEQMCVWLQKSCSGTCFSKGPGNISGLESCFVFPMFTFKIKVSIILKMIQSNYQSTKQNWPVCELGTVLLFNKFWF